MERIIGIETKDGVLEGRNAIYLDTIKHPRENEVIFGGELDVPEGFKPYSIKFYGIIFMSSVELDFDDRGYMESFGMIEGSKKIKEFRKLDHSDKLKDNHRHFYFSTYDTVFEIVAEGFEWL